MTEEAKPGTKSPQAKKNKIYAYYREGRVPKLDIKGQPEMELDKLTNTAYPLYTRGHPVGTLVAVNFGSAANPRVFVGWSKCRAKGKYRDVFNHALAHAIADTRAEHLYRGRKEKVHPIPHSMTEVATRFKDTVRRYFGIKNDLDIVWPDIASARFPGVPISEVDEVPHFDSDFVGQGEHAQEGA